MLTTRATRVDGSKKTAAISIHLYTCTNLQLYLGVRHFAQTMPMVFDPPADIVEFLPEAAAAALLPEQDV